MPQHEQLSRLPLRLPRPVEPVRMPLKRPKTDEEWQQFANALIANQRERARWEATLERVIQNYHTNLFSMNIRSGLTSFGDTTNKGYFLGFARGVPNVPNGTPVFALRGSNARIDIEGENARFFVGDRDGEKYFEFDGEDVRIGRNTQLIGADAYNNDSIYWHTYFDSADSFTKNEAGNSPAWGLGSGGLLLSVFETGDQITLHKSVENGFIAGTWEKNRRFRCSIEAGSNFDFAGTSVQISTDASTLSLTGNDFGFFLDQSNDLQGFAGNGSSFTDIDLNTDVTAGVTYDLEAVFTPSEKVEFFVNGALKGSLTTTLPSSSNAFGFMSASLKRVGAGTDNTNLRLGEWRFLQE